MSHQSSAVSTPTAGLRFDTGLAELNLLRIIHVCRIQRHYTWEETAIIANHIYRHAIAMRALPWYTAQDLMVRYSHGSVSVALAMQGWEADVTPLIEIAIRTFQFAAAQYGAAYGLTATAMAPAAYQARRLWEIGEAGPSDHAHHSQQGSSIMEDGQIKKESGLDVVDWVERSAMECLLLGPATLESKPPMLMVHAGHCDVHWIEHAPHIASHFLANLSTVDGDGVFVPMNHPAYHHGGKVFRAAFFWTPEGTESEISKGQADVMLCRKGRCSTCDASIPNNPLALDAAPAKPFVHSCCLESFGRPGRPRMHAFRPKSALRTDWEHPDPANMEVEVTFHGGRHHDVQVCIASMCGFCRAVRDSA